MPLHRKKDSTQQILNFKGMNTYVKENNSLSQERVTVFIQVAVTKMLLFNPSLCWNVKGQEQLFTHQLESNIIGLQKDCLQQMFYTISNLPSRFNIFIPKNYVIYLLDD